MESSSSYPMLSVVIPCYNGERFLRRSVESALGQEGGVSLEVIVVDDCSQDGSAALARQLCQSDSRCTLLCQPRNGGVSRARNAGLSACRGSYVTFLDADDWLFPHACRVLLEGQRKWGGDMTVGECLRVDEGGREAPVFPSHWRLSEGFYGDIFRERSFYGCQGMFDACWGKLFRRDVIVSHGLSFPAGQVFGEDTCFVLSYLAVAPQVAVLGAEACYGYYQHSSSCVHCLDVRKRLTQLLDVVSGCSAVCDSHGIGDMALLHKSKEVLFTVKRYGGCGRERAALLDWLAQEHGEMFGRVLSVLARHGKLKHRHLARLIGGGHCGLGGRLLRLW